MHQNLWSSTIVSLSYHNFYHILYYLPNLAGMGCYISKHGAPTRSSGYLKWESVATSYAHHGPHFLLFSPQFIEIRNTITGRLVQVIETVDARLLHYGSRGNTYSTILAAIKGDKEDKDGNSDKIIELVETSEITSTPTTVPAMWDEWDM